MSKIHPTPSSQKISTLFRVLGQPSHLEILLAIGTGEACVCHLEAATGWRQAYISQHLMALRSEGLVVSRRDGRNIYYRLKNASVLDLIRKAAGVVGISDVEATQVRLAESLPHCTCPKCSSRESHTHLGEAPNLAVRSS
jgi:DNA-binding transcriptional ArsR family regulator